jgi:hypothetical protein
MRFDIHFISDACLLFILGIESLFNYIIKAKVLFLIMLIYLENITKYSPKGVLQIKSSDSVYIYINWVNTTCFIFWMKHVCTDSR